MLTYVIKDNNNFNETLWGLRSSVQNQVILSLEKDINHHFAIRLFHKKFICIKSSSEREKRNYFIDISFTRVFDHDFYQNDSFELVGQSTSAYLFSNLIFKAVIKDINQLTAMNEISFLSISNQSNLTFLNCEFVNDTDKIYKIDVWHNSVVEFINCDFIGNFKFTAIDDSYIIR